MKNNLKVRLCLLENGLTQKELAERIGINPTTLCHRLRTEQPDNVQDWLCDLIQGSTKHLDDIRAQFIYRVKQEMTGTNKKVLKCLNENNMYKWELAEIIGIFPQQMSELLHTERPDDIQDALCEIINGDHQNTDKVREYFKKKIMAENKVMRKSYVNKIYREVIELENDIEKQKERDEWLYDYTTKGGKR